MKRLTVISCTIFIFLLSACSKDSSSSVKNGAGYWMIGDDSAFYSTLLQDTNIVLSPFTSTTYNVNYTGRKDSAGYFILYGYDSVGAKTNSIGVFFPSIPTFSANYKIIDFYPGMPLTGNQIGVVSNIPSLGTYIASSETLIASGSGVYIDEKRVPADSATVFVNDGKIKIILPTVLTGIFVSNGIDSAFLHGVIEEK